MTFGLFDNAISPLATKVRLSFWTKYPQRGAMSGPSVRLGERRILRCTPLLHLLSSFLRHGVLNTPTYRSVYRAVIPIGALTINHRWPRIGRHYGYDSTQGRALEVLGPVKFGFVDAQDVFDFSSVVLRNI